jgi:MFS family permease
MTPSSSSASLKIHEKDNSVQGSAISSPVLSPDVAKIDNGSLLDETQDGAGTLDFQPNLRFYMVFITLSIVTLASALDATSLSVALPIITNSLGGSAIEAFWAGTSFLLTSTVFQPVFASMSHIFGRKLVSTSTALPFQSLCLLHLLQALYLSLVFFAVGAILAALSKNFTLLLVGRSLQGVGGGGLIVIAEILVTDLVPLRQRGKWFGFLSSMWAIGSVSGPLVGGAFAEDVSWTWIFWINLPLIGIGLVMVTIFIKLNLIPGSITEKLRRFDWFGAFIFTASTTSVMIPITWGGVSYPWDSWHTLV